MKVNHRDQDEFLELLRTNRVPLGKGIGIDLDNHLRFKEGKFNIILGHANVGKTYWLLYYLLCLSAKHDLKHLIYSSENTVEGIKRNLLELYLNAKVGTLSKDEMQRGKDFIESHFDFIDTNKALTLDDFMKGVQGMGKYDTLMIDPHNSFLRPRGTNAHDYDYEMATRLRLFCKMTNTTIYLCIHAATEALRKLHRDGDYEGHPMPPTMADAEGGGKWGNRADDFLVIHRYVSDQDNWMYTHVHVKKVKETETGGKPTMLGEPVRFKLENGTGFSCNGVNPLKMDVNTEVKGNLNFWNLNDKSVPF
jgi:hypothetical protein